MFIKTKALDQLTRQETLSFKISFFGSELFNLLPLIIRPEGSCYSVKNIFSEVTYPLFKCFKDLRSFKTGGTQTKPEKCGMHLIQSL